MKGVDITNQAIEAGQCSERLQALGFRVWQAIDEQGAEVAQSGLGKALRIGED